MVVIHINSITMLHVHVADFLMHEVYMFLFIMYKLQLLYMHQQINTSSLIIVLVELQYWLSLVKIPSKILARILAGSWQDPTWSHRNLEHLVTSWQDLTKILRDLAIHKILEQNLLTPAGIFTGVQIKCQRESPIIIRFVINSAIMYGGL